MVKDPDCHLILRTLGRSINFYEAQFLEDQGLNQFRFMVIFENRMKISSWEYFTYILLESQTAPYPKTPP